MRLHSVSRIHSDLLGNQLDCCGLLAAGLVSEHCAFAAESHLFCPFFASHFFMCFKQSLHSFLFLHAHFPFLTQGDAGSSAQQSMQETPSITTTSPAAAGFCFCSGTSFFPCDPLANPEIPIPRTVMSVTSIFVFMLSPFCNCFIALSVDFPNENPYGYDIQKLENFKQKLMNS